MKSEIFTKYDLTFSGLPFTIFKAAGSRQQAAGSRQQAAGSRQQAAGSRQQAAKPSYCQLTGRDSPSAPLLCENKETVRRILPVCGAECAFCRFGVFFQRGGDVDMKVIFSKQPTDKHRIRGADPPMGSTDYMQIRNINHFSIKEVFFV